MRAHAHIITTPYEFTMNLRGMCVSYFLNFLGLFASQGRFAR
jgi:hypothetical protein